MPTPSPRAVLELVLVGAFATVAVLVQGCTTWSGSAHAEVRAVEARVAQEARHVADARGLDLQPPAVGLLSREELSGWFVDQAEQLPGDGRGRNERALRALGLIHPSETWSSLVGSVGAEALGAYDPDEDRILLVRPEDGALPTDVLRHELVHALQDQRWGLDARVAPSDAAAVVRVLAEGDATYTTLVAQLGGAAVDASDLSDFDLWVWAHRSGTPTSRYLRASANHPYSRGARVVQQLRLRGGWQAVDAAWAALPLSTEALLLDRPDDHPRYARLDVSGALGPGWRADPADTVGVFLLRDTLWALAPDEEPDGHVVGWDGDRLQILHHEDGRLGFVWRLVWDSDADAARFASMAKRALTPRGEPVEVELRGDEVLLVSGVPLASVAEAAFRDRFVEVTTREALRAWVMP